MIARIWHGEVASERADEYLDHLNRTGVPDYRATEGNRGVHVLRRLNEDRAHFLAVSLWESMQKIEGLAGADPGKARYYPGDERFLFHLDPAVGHYEIVVGP